MSELRFEAFDFNNGDWETYSERFAFFLQAHGVADADVEKQRAIFYASCGSDL